MIHQFEIPGNTVCQGWSGFVTSLLGYQWKLLDVQCEVGMTIVKSVLGLSPARGVGSPQDHKAEPQPREKLPSLEQRASERLRQGLAPPRVIYEVPNRNRLNWSDFPDWARPNDPELFEGCGHEG